MTEREKIAQIIAEHLCPQGKAHKMLYGAERMCYSRDNFAECEKVSNCVDALIAAGIGDVRKRPIDPTYEEYATQVHNLAIEEQKQRARAEEMRLANEELRKAVKEFAERVKMAFYYEFDELIPSTMADKIDEIVKEVLNEHEL